MENIKSLKSDFVPLKCDRFMWVIYEIVFLATHFENKIPNFSVQKITIRNRASYTSIISVNLNLLLEGLDSTAEKIPTNFKNNFKISHTFPYKEYTASYFWLIKSDKASAAI